MACGPCAKRRQQRLNDATPKPIQPSQPSQSSQPAAVAKGAEVRSKLRFTGR